MESFRRGHGAALARDLSDIRAVLHTYANRIKKTIGELLQVTSRAKLVYTWL
jgi:hypothetical protein